MRVRYADAYRLDPARMANTPIRADDGRAAPLSALAQQSTTARGSQSSVLRENLRMMALVTARLEGRDLGSAVSDLQKRLAAVKLPVGYSIEIGGQVQSQRQAFLDLVMVLGIAAALVLVVLVAEFRALTPAFLILCVAPLSAGGAFLLLVITRTDLNVSSAMGMILLVGLVVKNGIVLLDYAAPPARRRQHPGATRCSRSRTHGVRLRPRSSMTTLCTLFGLLPLALGLGAGAELQRPLALAVIGGLTLSTFITLYLVPLAYRALSRTAYEARGCGARDSTGLTQDRGVRVLGTGARPGRCAGLSTGGCVARCRCSARSRAGPQPLGLSGHLRSQPARSIAPRACLTLRASVIIGSTRVARRAGTRVATIDTSAIERRHRPVGQRIAGP